MKIDKKKIKSYGYLWNKIIKLMMHPISTLFTKLDATSG